jgi:5-(carboxyamino)imidazole ribonucleotide synthase
LFVSNEHQPNASFRVGVVGAGQLARMMGEAAADAGVHLTVLATARDDSAVATTDAVILGAATDPAALHELARNVDVITFDHELVDLEVLAGLEAAGVVLRPSSAALRFAVDKAYQRQAFSDAGLPVPRFLVVNSSTDERLAAFLDDLSGPPVVKASRGGYDGRGVAFPATRDAALTDIEQMTASAPVVVEERLELLGEVAQLVVRAVDGSLSFYPVVATVQRAGMCAEVRFPSDLDETALREAHQLSQRVAELVGGVGVLAIEYFVTAKGLLVNEVALRPHNTGHWTIEGAATSQFAQHLRAVSGQSLGDVAPLSPYAVMVNVVGADAPGSLDAAQDVAGTFVHDYGKSWRPGRKLGHVTALGEEPTGPHVRAWQGARAYGTVTREA